MNPDMTRRLSRNRHLFRNEIESNERVLDSKHFGHFSYCLQAVKQHNRMVSSPIDKINIILIGEGYNGEVIFNKFSIICDVNISSSSKRNFKLLLDSFRNYRITSCAIEGATEAYKDLEKEDIKDFVDNQINAVESIKNLNKFNTNLLNRTCNLLDEIIDLGQEILSALEEFDEDNKDKE